MQYELKNATVHYEICGTGRPLVVFHPLAMDYRSMQAWLEPLFANRPGWQRIYVDLPAHGQSTIDATVKTSDDLLTILLLFLDHLLGNERFSLVGMSFGGYMAQGVLYQRNEQIDGIALLAPVIAQKERTLPERVVLARDEDLFAELEEEVVIAFQTLMTVQTRDNWERFRDEMQPGRLLADREFLGLQSEWRTKGYFFSFDPTAVDTPYQQPALLLLGHQDAICGYQDHWRMLHHYPHATFAVLDQAGHLLQIEKRSLVQQLFADWLDRVEAKIND